MRLPSEGCSGSATDRRPPECWTEVSLLPFAYQHPRLDPGGGSRIPEMSEAEANARADEGDDTGGAGPPRATARPVFMPETFTGSGRTGQSNLIWRQM